MAEDQEYYVISVAAELTGILNGIDESWDPRSCAQLAQQFGAGDWVGKKCGNYNVKANKCLGSGS